MKKQAEWSQAEWNTFLRTALGGTLLGGGAAGAVALNSQLKALRDAAQREAIARRGVLEVPILKPVQADENGEPVVKNAFLPGPAGGWGLGAGAIGATAAYTILNKALQALRKQQTEQALQDAQEGYHQALLAETKAMKKTAAESSPFRPGRPVGDAKLATWMLWAGLPVTFALSMFGGRRALDKAFPKLDKSHVPLPEKLVLPVTKEVATLPKQPKPDEDTLRKEAGAMLLPLLAVLGHPDRIKSACLVEPWLQAARRAGDELPARLLVQKEQGLLKYAAEDEGDLTEDMLAGFALLKNASLAPAFCQALAAEYSEACPSSFAQAVAARPSASLDYEITKTAGVLGELVLAEAVADALDMDSEEVIKSASAAAPGAVAVPVEIQALQAAANLARRRTPAERLRRLRERRGELRPEMASSVRNSVGSADVRKDDDNSADKEQASQQDPKSRGGDEDNVDAVDGILKVMAT